MHIWVLKPLWETSNPWGITGSEQWHLASTIQSEPPALASARTAVAQVTAGSLLLPWAKDPVARGLRAVRRRERLYHLLAVLLGCGAFALAWLTGTMLADRLWELSRFTRLE